MSDRLFPPHLLHARWRAFEATGYTRPVTGIVYRGAHPVQPLVNLAHEVARVSPLLDNEQVEIVMAGHVSAPCRAKENDPRRLGDFDNAPNDFV